MPPSLVRMCILSQPGWKLVDNLEREEAPTLIGPQSQSGTTGFEIGPLASEIRLVQGSREWEPAGSLPLVGDWG